MDKLRSLSVGVVTVGLLAITTSGALAQGQSADIQGPDVVELTATFPWGPQLAAGTSEVRPDGVTQLRGATHQTRATEASDPRFEGEMVYTWTNDDYPGETPTDQTSLTSTVFRIENDDGAWQSRPALGLEFSGSSGYGPFGVFTAVFDGVDAYAGLTAIVEVTEVAWRGWSFRGLIIEGDLPPDAEVFEAS